jgi:predicted MFS family arabinose efflux permease
MILKIAQLYKQSFSGLSRNTWLLSVVMLINRASTMVVPFMSMYLTQSMHRSIADAGIIITLFGIGSVLGTMAGGYIIDRIGFRSVQIFTAFGGGILFILFGLVDHFLLLCILTLALSVVAEAFRPANYAAIATFSTPENLTRSYSLNRLATNLGWGLGISIGGILAAINYHLLFWVEGFAYMVIGLLLILLLPSGSGRKASDILKPAKEANAPLPGEEVPGALEEGPGGIPAPSSRSQSPWKDPFVVRFVILATMYFSCFVIIFRLVPVYWKEYFHINESVIGLLLGLNGIIIAIFEMVLVRQWEGRRTKMFYIVSGVLVTALGFLALVLPGVPPLLAAICMILLITIGEMMAVPFMNTIIMERSNASNRGKYSAAYALAWSIGQIAGPGGGALIIEKWGYISLWMILVSLCLICAIIFKMLSRSGKYMPSGT